ncbi:MAG: NB-ARC domain-containing protein [Isosphaeraceae bacterium]|jgi:hypothetical protein
MPSPLRLTLTDYLDATRWRWVLSDSRGRFLADHVVQLDPTTREYSGFLDLRTYLDYYQPIHPPAKQLEELGTWIGEKVFGGLRKALWARRALPAVAVQVVVPEAAQDLLFRPFELACFANGKSFREAGVRFVYGLEGTAAGAGAKEPVEKALRILAAFSLPVLANPLNLRRERYGLQRLVRDLNQTQNLAVELRVLQYGAARGTLREALHGMPGAGKTACALELTYRHEHGRFQGYVWHRAPEAGSDISSALFNLMQDIQTQLNAPTLGLTTALDDPQHFRQYTLPRLRALLKQNSLLLVLDNLETLLTDSDGWRDPLWGEVVAALLAHDGPSRVVLTSRRVPAGLANHAKVQVEPIHALSFAESVLLARELPNLKRLFDDEAGRALVQQTLRVVQGHPKLLELADGLAADRPALAARVAAAANELADRADVLDAFFAVGVAREGETRQQDADFVRALQGWTAGVAGALTPTAGLLFAFLCRLEPDDRRQDILEITWKHFLARLGEGHAVAVTALAEPEQGLPAALAGLAAVGLVGVERPPAIDPEQIEKLKAMLADHAELGSLDPAALHRLLDHLAAQATTYTIHPGVAETVRAVAEPAVLAAVDVELGNYLIVIVQHGEKTEMEGGGSGVVEGARRAAPYLLRQARRGEASILIEPMVVRDQSPDSLAFALPLLRRIVEATTGTERELIDAGQLASTLSRAGRTAEAEPILRDVIARGAAQGDYRVASCVPGELCNLLQSSGRLEEALRVAEEMAGYTRQAGLGPWTQLSDEGRRLQVLADMGRYDEVLVAVEALRPQMEGLPLTSEAEEAANPWNVREALLDTGHTAALHSGRWETALALNAEVAKDMKARGADALMVARSRFNDYRPLLALRRYDDARNLLLSRRPVFEAERDIPGLGKVYIALADLEDKTGGRAEAVRFGEVGLGYTYQSGEPEDCAISHHNLAISLNRQGADPATVLAHRLAAATIRLQMQSGLLPTTLRDLAKSDPPPTPPSFSTVAERVEAVEGVRFQALFKRLPRTAPDGDAALAAVWQMVADEKRRQDEERQRQDGVLAAAPAAVRAAFEREGDEFAAALRAALAAMPEAEATALKQRLREAGLISGSAGPDMTQVLQKFEPLLQGIAAAVKDEGLRAQIEPVLALHSSRAR